jgi:protein-S-isoprenylcysteine O-methyltransferase Ste14
MDLKDLKMKVMKRFVAAFVLCGTLFFIPAGTFRYWQAWLYMTTLFIPMSFVFLYLLKHDPDFLERRIRMKEKLPVQRLLMKISWLYVVAVFTLPGFDRRYHWSSIPPLIVIAADVIIFAAYILFVLVLKENRYASRVIEVESDQKIVTTGPYRFIRHPMYLAALTIYIATPVALGSWWALMPAVLAIPIVIVRLLSEEKLLRKELKGYEEYMRNTNYRLIPGIW